MKRAVFLDRDGTINEEVDYLDDLADLRLIRGADEGIRMLNEADLSVIVITNQSGVARGFFSEDFVCTVHSRLSQMLERAGARVDGWYFCPHHPDKGYPPYRQLCSCRKPGTAMIARAVKELGLDPEGSFVIGDSLSDLQTAWRAGLKAVLVLTGHGRKTMKEMSSQDKNRIYHVADDLLSACRWIIESLETWQGNGSSS